MKIGLGGRGTVARCPHAVHSTSRLCRHSAEPLTCFPLEHRLIPPIFLTPFLSSPLPATPPLPSVVSTTIVLVPHSCLSIILSVPCVSDPANCQLGIRDQSSLPYCMCVCNIGFLQCILRFSIAYFYRILKPPRCFPGPLSVLPLRHL